jgi:hypothetical protein
MNERSRRWAAPWSGLGPAATTAVAASHGATEIADPTRPTEGFSAALIGVSIGGLIILAIFRTSRTLSPRAPAPDPDAIRGTTWPAESWHRRPSGGRTMAKWT